MRREAQRTATQEDDAIVRRIAALEQQVARADEETAKLRASAQEIAKRRVEIERTRDRFRSAGFDHPNARFGNEIEIGQVHMDFHYKDYFQNAPSTGYETLIYDCMIGDATLFQRSDSVMAGWDIVRPMQEFWANDPQAPLASYAAGSDGPAEADDLLGNSQRAWRTLS